MNYQVVIFVCIVLCEIICSVMCVLDYLRNRYNRKSILYGKSAGWIIVMSCGFFFTAIGLGFLVEHPHYGGNLFFSLMILLCTLAMLYEYGYLGFGFDIDLDKWNLFKDKVENTNVIIVFGIGIFCACLYMPLSTIYDICHHCDAANTEYIEGRFATYEIENATILLTLENSKTHFEIVSYKSYGDTWHEELFQNIDQRKNFHIHAEYHNGSRTTPERYIIYNLTDESNSTYITFEQANELDKQFAIKTLPIALLFPVVWIFICIVLVVFIRNKDRFKFKS